MSTDGVVTLAGARSKYGVFLTEERWLHYDSTSARSREERADWQIAARTLPPLNGGAASSCQILLIERLTDQRLDDRLPTDVQLLGSPVQFFQHARREVHIHPLDWTHHAPLVGKES